MTDSDRAGLEAEARERWGDTDAYKESSRRTKRYTEDDWARINARQSEIEAALAEAMADGAPAQSERARELAEAARAHIDRWFYPCSRKMHAGLAEMYTADERFRAHYEERAEGLAEYVAAAIRANAAQA
jgi:MerR family transcriptional regulator, thiopeptide resistance regulator